MIRRLGAVLVIAPTLLLGCDTSGDRAALPLRTPLQTPQAEDSLIIGLVGTLSGSDAWKGSDAFEGADVAIHQMNGERERGEPSFELVSLDDGGDAPLARELVQGLAANPRVVGVIYAGPTQGLPPAETSLSEAGIPALICYGDLYSARLLQPHLFQVSPPLLWQARRIARYLLRDRRYQTVGLVTQATLDGRTAQFSLDGALKDFGGSGPVAVSLQTDTDPARALRQLRQRRVEALVVQGSPDFFAAITKTLGTMKAAYRSTDQARIRSAPPSARRRRARTRWWHPQVVGFDQAISAGSSVGPPGTAAADSYARGAHYLPVPSFDRFEAAFEDWWGEEPRGFERRAFEAARIIGWAARRAEVTTRSGDHPDLSKTLESLRGQRFGGLDVILGPDDHTTVGETSIGLWVIPRATLRLPDERFGSEEFPWVPLSRGFSINGRRTSISSEDWRYLFKNPPPPDGPAPRVTRARFGVATGRSDPVH